MAAGIGLLPPRYHDPGLVGHGGMGEVYCATDEVLGRPVAIKVLAERHADNAEIRERFLREARSAARLSHEQNTVSIYDVGEWEGRPFIVMEYLPGGSLADRAGPQRTGDVVAWIEQAARALDAAHAEGVVHRDIKPGNLLLDREGRVHVADFGIATAFGQHTLTQTGTILGTAGYLSPEQARGERATAASDRYALAVVAFELLTGKRPYERESATAEATAHVHAEIPSARELNADLPPAVDGVFERALAKDPAERYEAAETLAAALRTALSDQQQTTRMAPIAASAPAPAPAPVRAAPRRRSAAPALVALLGALAAGGGIAAWLLTRGDEESTRPTTVVQTVTAPGTTIRQTVTTEPPAPPPPPPSPPSPPSPPATASGHELNDQGFALMTSGDYAGALPILQQAVDALRGAGPGDPYEGYANYNLGVTLVRLGRCEESLPYLERSLQLQPDRSGEIGPAIKAAEKCARKGGGDDD